MNLPESITNLVEHFGRLPGVGEKTAFRNVMYITKWTQEQLEEFSEAINKLKELKKCHDCGFLVEDGICELCSYNKNTEKESMIIVETISDYMAISKGAEFRGQYHILGGTLNPLLGVGPKELGLDQLISKINEKDVKEIILALGSSVEGDATCSYIRGEVKEDIQVERIGFGIPMGGSLEFLDPLTITKALENRRMF